MEFTFKEEHLKAFLGEQQASIRVCRVEVCYNRKKKQKRLKQYICLVQSGVINFQDLTLSVD